MVPVGSVPRGREDQCASQNRRASLGAAAKALLQNAERASDIDTRGFTQSQTRAGALRDQGRCLGGSLSRK